MAGKYFFPSYENIFQISQKRKPLKQKNTQCWEANEIITINFKTTKGSKESVQIAKSATVEELKQKIEEKSSDLSADRQRVIYKGRVLKNDKTTTVIKWSREWALDL